MECLAYATKASWLTHPLSVTWVSPLIVYGLSAALPSSFLQTNMHWGMASWLSSSSSPNITEHLSSAGIVLGMVGDRAANGSICLVGASMLIKVQEIPRAQSTCWARIFFRTRHKSIRLHGVFTEQTLITADHSDLLVPNIPFMKNHPSLHSLCGIFSSLVRC